MGVLPPVVRSPGWGTWHGAQDFQFCGRISVMWLASCLCTAHPVSMGLDFIVIVSLLPFCCGLFIFGCRVSFLVRFLFFFFFLVSGCSEDICEFCVCIRRLSSSLSTPPSWANQPGPSFLWPKFYPIWGAFSLYILQQVPAFPQHPMPNLLFLCI